MSNRSLMNRFLSTLLILAGLAFSADAQTCPPEGNAKQSQVQALNLLKNREQAPAPNQIDQDVTVEALLKPGNDWDRWSDSLGADLVAYVWDVKVGGIESTNCKAKDATRRDTHIELVADVSNTAAVDRVIVEVTPRWRKDGRSRQRLEYPDAAEYDQTQMDSRYRLATLRYRTRAPSREHGAWQPTELERNSLGNPPHH